MTIVPDRATIFRRLVLVGVGVVLWFFTQSLIGARPLPAGSEAAGAVLSGADQLIGATESLHRTLMASPRSADALLIVTSSIIDLLAVFLILSAILGKTIRPFLGLFILFGLRQLCQSLCALPPPVEMIWRDPGFPSLFVTYGVGNDFFFSGHTAIAVFGACELARRKGFWIVLGVLIAVLEAATVIVLRAHYTMDVFTGIVTALWVAGLAASLSPRVDRWLDSDRASGVVKDANPSVRREHA